MEYEWLPPTFVDKDGRSTSETKPSKSGIRLTTKVMKLMPRHFIAF